MSKLRKIAKVTLFATFLAATGWAGYEATRPAYDGNVGIEYGTAYAPERAKDIDFNVWYPATSGGKMVTVGGNGVFFGTPAGRNAPHRTGQFPLVLISHGAGGNAGQFGWIASELVKAGFVVVIPNHTGTTSGNASAEAAVRVWERPADISAVIDEITSNPDSYPYIDPNQISMLGFSAGGYTAMAVSGARVDPDKLSQFCDAGDHGMSDCAFLAHFGINLHDFDLSPASQDLRDPRIQRTVAVDPGIIETITPKSLASIDIPMLILNLGNEDEIPSGVYALPAAMLIPNAEHSFVPDATHFSFLAECKERGAEILMKEGEPDPLCDDAGGRSRAALHAELSATIVSFLKR